jgi:charged multivesicular body protein 3
MGLFGKDKKPDPKEQVNEWSRKIRKEKNGLDRQIRQIQRGEAQAVASIKQAAKKNDPDSAKILAREVVNARKAVTRIHTAKANLNSVEMQMKAQAAQLRIAGSLSKSTEVMKSMQQLVKLPEIQQTMMEMSKEMCKAGIMEEMMEDAMETLEPEDLEEDIQTEVDKVISELTADKNAKEKPALKTQDTLRLPEVPGSSTIRDEEEPAEEEEVEEDLAEMQSRLQALRS